MAAATIVHDTSEAVELCAAYGLYLKPITKMSISVALPQLKQPGKSISNWEVMERLKAMVQHHQFSTLRIAKSTMEFIRFEGEVENKSLVAAFLACLDGKTIKLSGFSDILRVRAAEFKLDFPSRHDWDSFFRDAQDMNETLPGERPDTVHLEGLPCKWFARRDAGPGAAEKPSEEVLVRVFERFGAIRHVDIPMLDPYREEMTGRNFHTFSFGGHLNFEAYVQYREYAGFIQAMSALRGMKLMFKGEDGKAVACNIKVTFDSTKHLSDASIKKRQLERQKLQELEQQREEQKRREKEAEERQRAEERKQKELEEQERERKREEKLRRREQRHRERDVRRSQKQLQKLQAQEQLQDKIRLEERKLLLAQRNLQSLRLVAELLSRAKAAKQLEQERREEQQRRRQLEERRRLQAAELRRVEEEKERALGLQRRERELRGRLLSILLNKRSGDTPGSAPTSSSGPGPATTTAVSSHADLLQPVLDILQSVSALGGDPTATAPASVPVPAPTQAPAAGLNGTLAGDPSPEKRGPSVLACIAPNAQPPKGAPLSTGAAAPCKDTTRSEHDKCNREPSSVAGGARGTRAGADDEPRRERSSRPRRAGSREETRSERRARKKRSRHGGGTTGGGAGGGGGGSTPRRRSTSPDPPASASTTTGSRARRSRSPERPRARRERSSREHGRKRSRHRRGDRSRSRSRSGTPGRHRNAWNR